jgi:hypothetical protein
VAHPLGSFLDRYQKWGFSTIPIRYRDKKPTIEWGEYQTRMPDNAELGDWFTDPETNIAIVCGAVSGNLVVLDFDAEELYEDFKKSWPGSRPVEETTPVVKTGGGGHHVYIRVEELPQLFHPKGDQRKTTPDIQSEGGYVLAPPSIHPSGKPYEFLNSDIRKILRIKTLDALGIADIPLAGAEKQIGQTGQPNWVSQALQGVGEGERDNTAIRLAGYFRSIVPENVCTQILIDWAGRCNPPFPLKDVEKCVKSAYGYQPREGAPKPPADLDTGPPCYDLMLQGVSDNIKQMACFRLAVLAHRKKIPKRTAKATLTQWDESKNDPPLGDMRLGYAIRDGYSGRYKIGCPDITAAGYCSQDCPLFEDRFDEVDGRVEGGTFSTQEGIITLENCTLSGLTKNNSNPPTYNLVVNQEPVELSYEQFFDFGVFKRKIATTCDFLPILPPARGPNQARWERITNQLMAAMRRDSAPPEASEEGVIKGYLRDYLKSVRHGESAEDIQKGMPVLEDGIYLFKILPFRKYLKAQGATIKPEQMWQLFRKWGGDSRVRRVAGSEPLRVWEMPADGIDF